MSKEKICFLVGSLAISGGTYVIVQHASFLHELGYDVTLAVQEPFSSESLAWHDQISKLNCVAIDFAKNEFFDVVVATWWKTALELPAFNARSYAYFVQSIESRFYPSAEAPLRALVDATYQLPVAYVTEAHWIRDHLATIYGHEVAVVRNGIRKDVYKPFGPVIAPRDRSSKPRVLVEGHFGVPFKNTALALRIAREAGAKDLWLLTGTPIKWLPNVSRVFSMLPIQKTSEVYRSCDILLKLSTVEGMFGPPLEIFHCGGTAIVFDVSGHDEYIVDNQNARVVRSGDIDGVVTILRRLINDRDELDTLQMGALKTAQEWPTWEISSRAFHQWILSILSRPSADKAVISELIRSAWANYAKDEGQRISAGSRSLRQRLHPLVAQLPTNVIRAIKQIDAVREVLLGNREVL